ncbi:hypothetical protein ABEG63_08100 [Chryseobacterium sp. C39-AII1]|uniref:AAA family ATPase n=1 Tax=Chryseobacterium sp. C39-AII1 TaxID=3080332 RepID=UPI0032078A6A
MSFKLLAIRPLDGCNPKFLKNLQENRIYKFYNDYGFQDSNGNEITDFSKFIEVTKIEPNSVNFTNLYGDKIKVSAIVGKNGSGKSALVELFIACINQISLKLKNEGDLTSDAELITATKGDRKKIKCQIFYEYNDNEYFVVEIDDRNFSFKNFNNNSDVFNLKNFFYSEVINYSIYAFNSNIIGEWIDRLFHKNDSYQIPVVINPKRDKNKEFGWSGIIDVNNEKKLLEQRILVNLLRPIVKEEKEFRKIGDNMLAKKISITNKDLKDFYIYTNFKKEWGKKYIQFKEKEILYEKIKTNSKLNFSINFESYYEKVPTVSCGNPKQILYLIKKKYNIEDIQDTELQMRIDYYLIYKVISICNKYKEYKKFKTNPELIQKSSKYRRYNIKIGELISKIEKDKEKNKHYSHIIYKLIQTINYVKNYNKLWKNIDFYKKIDLDKLSKELDLVKKDNEDLIELLPPPIFTTEIFLEDDKNKKLVKLSDLSSGEQQLIHSISSVTYHLNNINSVNGTEIIKYEYVNLIFDEIELYFHPEFQRKLVNYLLKQINNTNLNSIKGINILFITHSPFILSDIAKQNVLFLEVDEETKKSIPREYKGDNTFAENIHEMLTDGFFITSTKGEFAVSKINEFLVDYKKWIDSSKKDEDKMKKDFEDKKQYYFNLIMMIGEEYIRKILESQFNDLEVRFNQKSSLQMEEENLIKRLIAINPNIKIDYNAKN